MRGYAEQHTTHQHTKASHEVLSELDSPKLYLKTLLKAFKFLSLFHYKLAEPWHRTQYLKNQRLASGLGAMNSVTMPGI